MDATNTATTDASPFIAPLAAISPHDSETFRFWRALTGATVTDVNGERAKLEGLEYGAQYRGVFLHVLTESGVRKVWSASTVAHLPAIKWVRRGVANGRSVYTADVRVLRTNRHTGVQTPRTLKLRICREGGVWRADRADLTWEAIDDNRSSKVRKDIERRVRGWVVQFARGW